MSDIPKIGIDVGCFVATCDTSPVSYTQGVALQILSGREKCDHLADDDLYLISSDGREEMAEGVVFHKVRQLGHHTLITLTHSPEQTQALLERINRTLLDIFNTDPSMDYHDEDKKPLAQLGSYEPDSFVVKKTREGREERFMKFFEAVGGQFPDPEKRFEFIQLVRTHFVPQYFFRE